MNKKSLFLVCLLALFCLSTAVAKSYTVWIPANAKAGSVQFAAGEYQIKVDGTKAVFTNAANRKTYTVPVKLETAPGKFEQSRVVTKQDAGSLLIDFIELGGSTTKIQPE